jgi:DNA-binding NtrC family response regulator
MERAPSILIVDAQAARGESLVRELGARALNPRAVANSHQAARALAREDYVMVVISDADPLRVAREVRAASPAVPMLVIGECRDWPTVVELGALGVMDVVKRATAGDDLARKIRKLLPGAAA